MLGRGSFGKVLLVRLAREGDAGPLLAMKSVHKTALDTTAKREAQQTERRVLATIKSDFLVGKKRTPTGPKTRYVGAHSRPLVLTELLYAFQSGAKVYLVLTYMAGGELFSILKQDTYFSEARTKLYAAELVLGLGALHAHGVVYRDLKPENVLLDQEGHLRIADFGLSKELGADGTSKTFCGTPDYLAPEVILCQPHDKAVGE